MGFLGFLKKKEKPAEEPVAPKVEDVKIEALSDWFSRSFGQKLDSARNEARGMFRTIASCLESMEKASRGLSKAEFETGDKTYAAVNMIKDDYVKKLKKAFLCTSREPGDKYESIAGFHKNASSAIGELLAIGPRQAILLSRYFSSEMKTVVSKLKETKETLDKMGAFLRGEGSIIRVNDELSALLSERADALRDLEDSRRQVRETERRRDDLLKEASEAEARLKEFEDGEEWRKYNSLKESLRQTEVKASEVESAVRSALSVTKRPLKKLNHVTDQKVDALISDPFGEFSANPAFFSSMLEKMLETDIGLKGKEKEKLQALSKRMASLEKQAARHRELADRAADSKKQLEACMALKEREKLEARHSDARSRAKRLESDIAREKGRTSQISDELESFRKRAERLVNNNTDRRVRLAK